MNMNTLMPFKKFVQQAEKLPFSSSSFVVKDTKGFPVGFVFGRDSFISFLEHVDHQFEELVEDETKAFHNPAGQLIDAIEEKLPVNPKFVRDLQQSHIEAKSTDWIPLEEVSSILNV